MVEHEHLTLKNEKICKEDTLNFLNFCLSLNQKSNFWINFQLKMCLKEISMSLWSVEFNNTILFLPFLCGISRCFFPSPSLIYSVLSVNSLDYLCCVLRCTISLNWRKTDMLSLENRDLLCWDLLPENVKAIFYGCGLRRRSWDWDYKYQFNACAK